MERAARDLLVFSFVCLLAVLERRAFAALVSLGGALLVAAVAAGGVVARGLLRGSQASG